jgi:hypothetical protein
MGQEALGVEMSELNMSAPTAEVVCQFSFNKCFADRLPIAA